MPMHCRYATCRFFVGLVICFAGASVRLLAAEVPNKTELSERCLARESAVQKLRIEWAEECFDAKGSKFNPDNRKSKVPYVSETPLPPEDVSYKQSHAFAMEGKRTSHSSVTQPFGRNGKMVEENARAVFNQDGRFTLSFPNQERSYPYGRIYEEGSSNQELNLLLLEPVLFCYRLFHTDWRLVKHQQYNVRDETAFANGVSCVIFEEGGSTPLRRMFWLDPERDYLVIKFSLYNQNGGLQREAEFEYEQKVNDAWHLKSWLIHKYDRAGELSNTVQATVTSLDVNPELNESEFTIDFPEGTFVDDLRKKRNFIQRESGKIRVVLSRESDLPYEKLAVTEEGQAVPLVTHNSLRPWFLVINVGLFLLVACVYLLRRKPKQS